MFLARKGVALNGDQTMYIYAKVKNRKGFVSVTLHESLLGNKNAEKKNHYYICAYVVTSVKGPPALSSHIFWVP